MSHRALAWLLLAVAGTASAQAVTGSVFGSRDSDGFEEAAVHAGFWLANGWGLRAGSAHYRAPGWSSRGASLLGTYRDRAPGRRLDASLGLARTAGHDHAVGELDSMVALSSATGIGASVERGVVNSTAAINAGLVHTSAALVADHAFSAKVNVGLAAGVMLFSDDNRRPFLRTRWNVELQDEWGLNAFLKTRSLRNSEPYSGVYYAPRRLNEAAVGLSARLAVAEAFVFSAAADAGRQHADGAVDPVWSASLSVGSLRMARVEWRAALQMSNTAPQVGLGPDYRFASLRLELRVPM